jgi:hypothetical protein
MTTGFSEIGEAARLLRGILDPAGPAAREPVAAPAAPDEAVTPAAPEPVASPPAPDLVAAPAPPEPGASAPAPDQAARPAPQEAVAAPAAPDQATAQAAAEPAAAPPGPEQDAAPAAWASSVSPAAWAGDPPSRTERLARVLEAVCLRLGLTGGLVAESGGVPLASVSTGPAGGAGTVPAALLGEALAQARGVLDATGEEEASLPLGDAERLVLRRFSAGGRAHDLLLTSLVDSEEPRDVVGVAGEIARAIEAQDRTAERAG